MRRTSLKLIVLLGLLYNIGIVKSISAPDFISGWHTITAYSANSEVTIPHSLGSIPLLVDVQVKVNDPTEGDIIFTAIGSAQKGNDDSLPFGGIVYIYNDEEIKLYAPGPNGCTGNCAGGIVYLEPYDVTNQWRIPQNGCLYGLSKVLKIRNSNGYYLVTACRNGKSGGGYSGPTTGSGIYTTGQVRVRAWTMCTFLKPTFYTTAAIPMSADALGVKYTQVRHGIGFVPDMVVVQAQLQNGYVMDGHGSAFYTRTSTTFGGLIYGYNEQKVKLWIPETGAGKGGMFAAQDGWGPTGDAGYSLSGDVKVYVWLFEGLDFNPKLNQIEQWKGHGSAEDIETIALNPLYDLDYYIFRVQVTVDEIGNNDDFIFSAAGTTMTEGTVVPPNQYYGSLIYGVKHTGTSSILYMWRPSDTTTGCMTVVGGMWGSGVDAQCCGLAKVTIKMFKTSAETPEPVCGALPCNSTTTQGPVCDCSGTGMEGQFCQINIYCFNPYGHQNAGVINWKLQYLFNTSAILACNTGYQYVSGSYQRVCQEDKTWTGQPLVCEPVPCPAPLDGTNSITNTSGRITHVYLDEVYYTCITNYSLKTGNLTTFCGSDQTWQGDPPLCEPSCGDPLQYAPTAARTDWGNTVGVIADFVCKTGYEYVSGDFNRTCQSDGIWDNTPLICTKKDCGVPLGGNNSALTYTTTLYQDAAKYVCTEGYHELYATTKYRYCQADQTWSGTPMDCVKVQCGIPVPGNFTQLTSFGGNQYLDQIEFECIYGYILKTGSLSKTCQANQTWSGETPHCEEIICVMPSFNVPNGTLTLTGTSFGSMAVVVCDDGFAVKNGNAMRMCDLTASWTGTEPECKSVQYIFLEDNPNGFGFGGYIGSGTGRGVDIEDLRIPPKTTDNYKRTLRSIWEDRPSVIAIGSVGTLVLVSVVGFICFLDCLDLAKYAARERQKKHKVEENDIDNIEHNYTNDTLDDFDFENTPPNY